MKKNLISVIILALVLANFVLTGLLVFTVLPQTKKANQMIEAVCTAIDLDLKSGAATGVSSVPIDQIVDYALNGGEKSTLSFDTNENGEGGFLVVGMSLSLNNKSDAFKKYGAPEVLATYEPRIQDRIQKIVHSFTLEQYNENPTALQDAILADLQEMFDKDFIIGVNFITPLTQSH